MPRLWETYKEVVELVRQDHKRAGALVGTGHDFLHALMTAQYAEQISGSCLGWLAGICHNTDRLFKGESDKQISRRVRGYLASTRLSRNNVKQVVEAVINHSGRPSSKDKPVTIWLMDADKLGNLGGLLVIRCGQFQPNIPPINLRYLNEYPPGCNYVNPGSIYRDICSSLEWEQPGWFRLPKAIELAEPLFAQLRIFLEDIVSQLQGLNLFPYPFEKDFESI